MVRIEDQTAILLHSLHELSDKPIYRLATKEYRQNYLTNDQANTLAWEEFKVRSKSIGNAVIPGTTLEGLVVPKSRTWSSRDVNIYVGNTERSVRYYNDLSCDEFVSVFDWHISTGLEISRRYGLPVNVSHGFNPDDSAPDAHSVRNKFHTHVYIPDEDHREKTSIKNLSWFDKLKVIEPYSQVYVDYAAAFLKTQSNTSIQLVDQPGSLSLLSKKSRLNYGYLREIYQLLKGMSDTYECVVDTFTDRTSENTTGYERFVPRQEDERLARIESFTTDNKHWLSPQSITLLKGMAATLQVAEPRVKPNSTNLAKSSQLWVAKGFSGAFNFKLSDSQSLLQFDFAPRVISTSGATKFITDYPTIVIKDSDKATDVDHNVLRTYERTVAEIITA